MNAATYTPQELIELAAGACRTLPPPDQLSTLDTQLRAELKRLFPIVEKQAEELPVDNPGRYSRQRALDATRDALDERLDRDAPLPAALLVAELGRQLRDLVTYAEEGNGRD
ncbi:DUF6415 family natural product biosynthesis protein [Streptomyces venezuelae]|uniref:Uncharacterized protein n=1 Tax=Streptomyces venezuelae TaxID=54571 RepID=A0A5P2B999_STRVZ|nr:DUF6415 family natural product biosynthesis protein [Streptomyces venezuelae]QES25781.1 hypothetical protein DEJ47_04330 [Streptomyces venezuelae]